VAHGDRPAPQTGPRTLIAVFESPVAEFLLRWGLDLGYRTVLVEPDPARLAGRPRAHGDATVAGMVDANPDANTDVVVTDHDRPELGAVLHEALARPSRWVGVMGSPRHDPPHVEALRRLGVDDTEIKRVHRPIGLNIGSRTPAEIAVATLAGLVADRNGRPGGFSF
jgi:xanthine/CO dehydrogenase XdhC/CoxF family maturation factor